MARKSCKTAHVLNLLAGGEPEKEEQQASSQEAGSSSDPAAQDSQPQNIAAAQTVQTVPIQQQPGQAVQIQTPPGYTTPPIVVQVVQAPSGMAQPTAPAVPDAPSDQSPGNSGAESGDSHDASAVNGGTADVQDQAAAPAAVQEPAEQTPGPSPSQQEPSAPVQTVSPHQESTESKGTASISVIDMSRKDDDDVSKLIRNKLVEENRDILGDMPDLPPLTKFRYINVMEHIIRSRVVDYMKQMDMCTCERCVADTLALSLTNLPPKYIVTDMAAVAPLLSFYANKYSSQALIELTKACLTVKDHPKH